jgi:hypothetical protein
MRYEGKLYAKVAGKYVPLTETTEDVEKMRQDQKRLNWMEEQAGHVFDKGQGDHRRIWKNGDPRTVRGEIDDMIKEEAEIYRDAMS